MTLTLPCQPRCPVCCQDLHPKVTVICVGFAYCATCARSLAPCIAEATINAFRRIKVHRDWSYSRGVHFWTPPSFTTRHLAFWLQEFHPDGDAPSLPPFPAKRDLPFSHLEDPGEVPKT